MPCASFTRSNPSESKFRLFIIAICRKIVSASSNRPLLINHRGLSGRILLFQIKKMTFPISKYANLQIKKTKRKSK